MSFMKRKQTSGGQRGAIVVDQEAVARAITCQSQNRQTICRIRIRTHAISQSRLCAMHNPTWKKYP